MSQSKGPTTPSKAVTDKQNTQGITAIEVIALILTALWLLGTAMFFLALESDGGDGGGALRFVMILLAIFMPVAMIWVAITAARASRVMREESQRLQIAIDAIRTAYVSQNKAQAELSDPSVAKKLEEIAAAQRKTETALATFSTIRTAAPAPAAAPAVQAHTGGDQVALPLGTTAEDIQPPLDRDDFIRALNFPENANDREGFAALRKALKDRPTAQLIQAAQDILTLMSHDGIYMDDLRPDMARPEIWRRFADGERGRTIAALGGIRDRSSLALTAARMKQDTIFRDAAHHFLRLFDRMFTQFAEKATDAEISDLSDTRTARAFMLLGRVAGTFD
jgi:hypothetical protein